MATPFNPLDKINLGLSIGNALLLRPMRPLADCGEEVGAGVYALYYGGELEPYSRIRYQVGGREYPIYVGKAIPAGARRGLDSFDAAVGSALRSRLSEHLRSIQAVDNLEEGDFYYRALVVEDIWIPLGESVLIQKFRPIWNSSLDGFGNHDPGAGRRNQARSAWDVLHPGRGWAAQLPQNHQAATLEAAVVARLLELIPDEEPADAGEQVEGDGAGEAPPPDAGPLSPDGVQVEPPLPTGEA